MTINGEYIQKIGAIVGTIISLFAIIFAIYRWYLKQNKQDKDIKSLKEENCIIVYGLLACLKGLKELGCNGPVSEAVDKMEKHINKKAHDMEE